MQAKQAEQEWDQRIQRSISGYVVSHYHRVTHKWRHIYFEIIWPLSISLTFKLDPIQAICPGSTENDVNHRKPLPKYYWLQSYCVFWFYRLLLFAIVELLIPKLSFLPKFVTEDHLMRKRMGSFRKSFYLLINKKSKHKTKLWIALFHFETVLFVFWFKSFVRI